MFKFKKFFVAVVFALMFYFGEYLFSQDGKNLEEKLARVVKESTEKTVVIVADFGGKEMPIGSGAVISADGYIVSNAHVIMSSGCPFSKTKLYAVIKGSKKLSLEVIGFDATKDTALTKVDASNLEHFEFGDSSSVKFGDFVVALGYPSVFATLQQKKYDKPCVSFGRVKIVNQKLPVGFTILEGITTDAPLSYGNSGGPLVNLDGKLIGINTAIELSKDVRSFSNPSNIVLEVVEKIKKRKKEDEPEFFAQIEQLIELAKVIYKMYMEAFKEKIVTEETVLEEMRSKDLKSHYKNLNKKIKDNIVKVFVDGCDVGYGVILNKDGLIATSRSQLFSQDSLYFTIDKLKEYAQKSDFLKELLGDDLLSTKKKFTVKIISEDILLSAQILNDFPDYGLTFLKVTLPKNVSVTNIKNEKVERGRFAISVTESDMPIAFGLISTDTLEVESSTWVPGSFDDIFKFFEDVTIFTPKKFKSVLFHDTLIEQKNLGSPVLNSKGELIGINLYSPTKGFTYAISINKVKELMEK